ncbi:MAG: helix-turn-helix domain-containing protein [Cyanobacteria bacterium P01_C01_bin.120]
MSTSQLKMWREIRKERCFRVRDLHTSSNCAAATARRYLRALAREGYVAKAETYWFRLIKDTGPLPVRVAMDGTLTDLNLEPDKRSDRDKFWQAMRISPTFTVGDIAVVTELELVKAKQLVSEFVRCGYVQRLGNRFRLVKNTGPLTPLNSGRGQVFDPNVEV